MALHQCAWSNLRDYEAAVDESEGKLMISVMKNEITYSIIPHIIP